MVVSIITKSIPIAIVKTAGKTFFKLKLERRMEKEEPLLSQFCLLYLQENLGERGEQRLRRECQPED